MPTKDHCSNALCVLLTGLMTLTAVMPVRDIIINDIIYQKMFEIKNVICLFLETRDHGVGYYKFSKVEEERQEQQSTLSKLRAQVT